MECTTKQTVLTKQGVSSKQRVILCLKLLTLLLTPLCQIFCLVTRKHGQHKKAESTDKATSIGKAESTDKAGSISCLKLF